MLICYLYILLGQASVCYNLQAIFKNQILSLSFKSSLYVLGNIPLSYVSLVNIFSQSMMCLFIFLAMSFTEQKSFNFNEVERINPSFYESCL